MAEVVTSENLAEFNMARLRVSPEPVEDAKIVSETPEPKAEDKSEPEAKPEADEHHEDDEPKKDPDKRPKLEKRFSELTEQRNRERERAEAAERRLAELEAKANPKAAEKTDEIGPKPDPKDYTEAFKYAEDLAEWSTGKALKDRDAAEAEKAQKAEQEKTIKAWQKRVSDVEKELPDYKEVLASADNLAVSDDVRDAIIDSDVGPKILYHLAQNPEEVERINGLTVRGALRAIGKLEAKFETQPQKEQAAPEVKIAKVKPPEPITPIRASNTPDNRIDAKGEFQGSYAQWKALRKAGKVA